MTRDNFSFQSRIWVWNLKDQGILAFRMELELWNWNTWLEKYIQLTIKIRLSLADHKHNTVHAETWHDFYTQLTTSPHSLDRVLGALWHIPPCGGCFTVLQPQSVSSILFTDKRTAESINQVFPCWVWTDFKPLFYHITRTLQRIRVLALYRIKIRTRLQTQLQANVIPLWGDIYQLR